MKKVLIGLIMILAGVFVYFSLGSSVTENLDTYIYDLPFKDGSGHKVVQGYGGRFSHTNKAALDFSMPVGTPVHAAREGVIYSYKDDSDRGGLSPGNKNNANYIIIKHNDGTLGCYWHLKKNGVEVKRGKVEKGQLIGYSGNTGFVLQPHLHFAVKSKLNYEMNSFVKTKFRTTKGVAILKAGKKYYKPHLAE